MYEESFVWGHRSEDCHKVLHAIAHFHSDPASNCCCAVLNPSRTIHAHLKTISTPGFHPHALKYTGSQKFAMLASYSIVIIMQWEIRILNFFIQDVYLQSFSSKSVQKYGSCARKTKTKTKSHPVSLSHSMYESTINLTDVFNNFRK